MAASFLCCVFSLFQRGSEKVLEKQRGGKFGLLRRRIPSVSVGSAGCSHFQTQKGRSNHASMLMSRPAQRSNRTGYRCVCEALSCSLFLALLFLKHSQKGPSSVKCDFQHDSKANKLYPRQGKYSSNKHCPFVYLYIYYFILQI